MGKITTKTVTTTDADGKKKVETFVEEEEDAGGPEGGHDLFKNRIRELRERGSSRERSEEEGEGKARGEVASSSSSDEHQCEEESGQFSKFQIETLKAHNELRAKHGAPAMELSTKMCTYAQEWADHLLAENRFQHRRNNKYGEPVQQLVVAAKSRLRRGRRRQLVQ